LNGDLPLGCDFNVGTEGTLAGIPEFPAQYIFSIEAADQSIPAACDTVQYSVTIEPPPYICGDSDGNGQVSIGDAVHTINYIFGGGPAPVPLEAADSDCNGDLSISDAVYVINFIFGGGPSPCASCG
jgi:hypothetical protein